MAISSLNSLTLADRGASGNPFSTDAIPIPGMGGGRGGVGGVGGGNSAQSGLETIGQGSQTVSQALNTASQALGTGSGGLSAFKKGGAVKSKARGNDWHGFGKSSTGKNNHGF